MSHRPSIFVRHASACLSSYSRQSIIICPYWQQKRIITDEQIAIQGDISVVFRVHDFRGESSDHPLSPFRQAVTFCVHRYGSHHGDSIFEVPECHNIVL